MAYRNSYVHDLLAAAKLAAVSEGDTLLVYLIEMAVAQADRKGAKTKAEAA